MSSASENGPRTFVVQPQKSTQNPSIDTNKYYCPFKQRGLCRSSRCQFSHVEHNSIKIPDNYCNSFLANRCSGRPFCQFIHGEPVDELNLEVNGNNMKTNRSSNNATTYSDVSQSAKSDENTMNQRRILTLCAHILANVECPFPPDQCSYLNNRMAICDICGLSCLDPYDVTQRFKHKLDCQRRQEHNLEITRQLYKQSNDKRCTVCKEIVVNKKPITSSRFGILPNCQHIFCLNCIVKYHKTVGIDNKIDCVTCPECDKKIDFIVPSNYWVQDEKDKKKLIGEHKHLLRSTPCELFDEGRGECPNRGKCLYNHVRSVEETVSSSESSQERDSVDLVSREELSPANDLILFGIGGLILLLILDMLRTLLASIGLK